MFCLFKVLLNQDEYTRILLTKSRQIHPNITYQIKTSTHEYYLPNQDKYTRILLTKSRQVHPNITYQIKTSTPEYYLPNQDEYFHLVSDY